MTSVLENEYIEPTRPYSQHELIDKRERLYSRLRLGKHKVHHQRTGYFYRVRVNGRKEREMIETNSNDVGNCSVSWKLSKTTGFLRDRALDLVENYCTRFEKEPEFLTYHLVYLEETFYNWLYEDQNHRRFEPRREKYQSSTKQEEYDNV